MDTPANEPKKGGNPSRTVLYTKASKYAIEMLEIIAEIARHGDNDNAKVAAARTLLNKTIPDLKAMEVYGKDGEKLEALVVIKHGDKSFQLANTSN